MSRWLLTAITKPGHYLGQLVAPTLLLGAVTLGVSWTYVNSPWYTSFAIAPGLHSLIGIVIGLLLVFRTNTAYDRWWEGRKALGDLTALVTTGFLASGCDPRVLEASRFHLSTLGDYLLRHGDSRDELLGHYRAAGALRSSMWAAGVESSSLDPHFGRVMQVSANLERIKSTPIPLSYALHIRVSLMVYLMSLPFGLFHDQGVWAVPMVMLVFYVVAGIEIISNEIEAPFNGDPNDLPVRAHLEAAVSAMESAAQGCEPEPQAVHQ